MTLRKEEGLADGEGELGVGGDGEGGGELDLEAAVGGLGGGGDGGIVEGGVDGGCGWRVGEGEGDGVEAKLAVFEFEAGFYFAGGEGLGVGAPAFGGDEGGAEIFGREPGREADVALRAVVLEATGGEEDAVTGHGAGIVVAALDFVPGIAAERAVAIVNGANDGEAFEEHVFPEHVGGDLILVAGPGLEKIVGEAVGAGIAAAGFDVIPIGAGKGAHDHAGVTGVDELASGFLGGEEGTGVGAEIIFPEAGERAAGFLFRQNTRQAELKRGALAVDLVDVGAVAGIEGVGMFGIEGAEKIFAVEKAGGKYF